MRKRTRIAGKAALTRSKYQLEISSLYAPAADTDVFGGYDEERRLRTRFNPDSE
jgi:hypothetical protein